MSIETTAALTELPALRGFADAGRFTSRAFQAGDIIAEAGTPVTEVLVVADGKLERIGTGRHGEPQHRGVTLARPYRNA